MTSPDGPPLFYPRCWHERDADGIQTDITLRDLFAGMALQGYLSEAGQMGHALAQKGVPEDRMLDVLAGISYLMADAMLKAREARDDAS